MKTRFNTYDIVCGVTELQNLVGQRVNQIYDIDNKTYLIRFQGGESKTVLLIESGIRFHTTAFEWPKNVAPSGFSMKLRKHLKNKRLEKLEQLGMDRIIDLQFGTGEAAYHVIVELYDRGNIILTDHELTILYILRPHYEGEEVRFAVREKYPSNRAKEQAVDLTENDVRTLIETAKPGDNLRRLLMPKVDFGPAVIDHVLHKYKLDNCIIEKKENPSTAAEEETTTQQVESGGGGKKSRKQKKRESKSMNMRNFDINTDLATLVQAIQEATRIFAEGRSSVSKGFVIQKREEKPATTVDAAKEDFYQNIEYHPYPFAQFEGQPRAEFATFMLAVDEFYSTQEAQKIDLKTLQQEREALKKLSNVKNDHAKRLDNLTKSQEVDKQKAELITCNQELVEHAIAAVQSLIASQMSWPDIEKVVKEAQADDDPIAGAITKLKLEINHISLRLSDPYKNEEDDDNNEDSTDGLPTLVVDVDLALSAWANARKYYDLKRYAAKKEQKTIDASNKALKSAERKTQQTLKEVRIISTISKARKVYWFEKFYWFISSENYLVIGGRDAQQNELIVKRYMRPTDIYVHAEIQGASSVVIRNPTGAEVPPKTLLEAGTMAISYSVAWDAKVVTNAYWVRSDQVTKTAPSGEYLGTGSFMIRGKKNFLPSCHLIMGLSLLFKLEDSFVERHRGERKLRTFEEEQHALEEQEQRLKELGLNEDVEINLDEELEQNEKLQEDLKTKQLETVDENAEDTDSSEDSTNFPDTQVKIEHDTGRITVRTDSVVESTTEDAEQAKTTGRAVVKQEEEEATIIPAAAPRKKQQQNAKKRKEEKERKTQQELRQQLQNAEEKDSKNSNMKRGQRGKLKKMKAKYKDQDDEERELRMRLLNSAGKDKIDLAKKKAEEELNMQNTQKERRNFARKEEPFQGAAEVDDDDMPAGADVAMLDALTGQPLEDDELLFVIPVVAPYQALQNYKFRVKLTPGTGKRGRAAKTALTMFSKDKNCGTREKDLLKSIKEEALARNIPGKVKLSAPQLQKFKK
ncbi:PREDICTED: nuclear export mediator factor NEMF homolog [Bactrocera latifrons]|uniref:nuclear export mediator factor NEMF homolog n=1 Tax=Bactrocera latifrons TaxID=174628 RepID=UPI0008DC60DC|nr:PREDICTED: nuclear export mediator factor NEMF homolog [Bactrocera latifrons]XP_018801732.1 PREDICTED: nuclear export mediator factor NEMF homolog [Bactrocera latifrons]